VSTAGKPRLLGGVLTAVVLLGASACATLQPFTGSGLPKIQFVGDSITVLSTADINAHYRPSHDVAIDALVGVDTFLMAHDVAGEAALSPAVEVINLGTNDASRIGIPIYGTYHGEQILIEPAQTIGDITSRLDGFEAEFPSTTCVVFVTINTHNPSWGPSDAQKLNDHIRATYAHVADWDAAWRSTYFDSADNPHPNETGRQALIALEDRAIAGCVFPSSTS
jgi:hypothetical protein